MARWQHAADSRPAVSDTVRNETNNAPAGVGASLHWFRTSSGALVDSVVGERDDLPLESGWDTSGVFDVVIEKAVRNWGQARV